MRRRHEDQREARTGAPLEFFYAYEWPTWAPATNTMPVVSVWPDGENRPRNQTAR